MSIWAALVPATCAWWWAGPGKPGRVQRAELGGSGGPVGGLASRVHGTKAVLGAPSGAGDTRTAPMPCSTKLPLPGWLWTEMPFVHWKHSPNSSTEVSSSSSLFLCLSTLPWPTSPRCYLGDVVMWPWAAELTREGVLPWVLFWKQDKEWEKHVTVN